MSTILVFLWAVGLVFVRTAFFDTLDMQGDRIVGKETIPTLLGEKKTVRLLKAILLINLSVLLLAAGFRLVPALGFLLPVCTAFVALVLMFYQRGLMIPGIRMEFLLESNFVLAGVTTLLWSVL